MISICLFSMLFVWWVVCSVIDSGLVIVVLLVDRLLVFMYWLVFVIRILWNVF